MKKAGIPTRVFLSNVKLFLALSRTTHGLLDLATPAVSALLWLGSFPSPWIVTVGLLTAFAGYTSVYALNDLVDYKADSERMRHGDLKDVPDYLDTVFVRHPLAQGALSYRKGVAWAAFWAVTALTGASMLGAVCALLFLGGVMLEAVYCLMLRVSHLRVLVSGLVKTLGGIAAVFAVDPTPSPLFITLLFLWLFFWEIGGQNLPADWHDMEDDSRLGYNTVPVRFGPGVASALILVSLIIAVGLGTYLMSTATGQVSIFCAGGSLLAGFFLLVQPAYQACRSKTVSDVDALFSKASLYPLALLVVLLLNVISLQITGNGMKEIDLDTLSKSNGKDGSPVYVAHKGRVIDVSKSKLWQTGTHMMRHAAGADLTADIEAAPHGPEVLDRYPEIGFLKIAAPVQLQRPMPAFLAKLLSRYPFFRRHPHPATVHFPIAFMVAASGFYVLYFVTGVTSFEVTAVHCLGAGILFAALAMGTGLFTWWLNYLARPVRQVTIKLTLSCIMLPDAIAAFIWRLLEPDILNRLKGSGIIYLLLVLALGPLALAIGYFGGTLTFPVERQEKRLSG